MIRNIALNAAYTAAGNGGRVTTKLVLSLTPAEFVKHELPVTRRLRPRWKAPGMKVRLDTDRLILHEQSMSRRERIAVSEEISREVSRLLQHGATADADRRSLPPVTTQIAAAITAASPPPPAPRMGRRR